MTTRVSVTLGFTRNMGNFESMRVDLGISDDSRDGETAGETFNRVYGKVESLLLDKVRELEEEIRDAREG